MADGHARNEGVVDLSYKPPKAFKKMNSIDGGAEEEGFEWDNLNTNPDIDVWAVRVPAGFNPSELEGLKIKLPSSGASHITGTLKTGGFGFKLRTVDGEDESGGGEEMENMRCIVPKANEDGALYALPRPIKHLILTPHDPIPASNATLTVLPQPSRRPQPVDRLKHAFAPIGAPLPSPLTSSFLKPMELNEDPEAVPVESPKKKRKKQATATNADVDIPKVKPKGKAAAKAAEAAGVDESMEVDNVEALTPKKAKKKSVAVAAVESQESDVGIKKGKKKRKAANED